MLWIAYLLIGFSIFILCYEFFKFGSQRKEEPKGGVLSSAVSKSLILRLSRPLIQAYLLPSVANFKIDNFRKEKKQKIASAGLTDELTADELFALKLLLALLLPLMALIYNFALNVANPIILTVIFGAVGYYFPELWLKSVIKERQLEIRLALPFVIDLLSLCTEAGLDFMAAIQRVVIKAKRSSLIDELKVVLNEIKLGTTRADALRNMAMRINMPEISSLVAVLVTAEQMGSSISAALKSQADQIRNDRFIRAEKAGAAASQKILFPLIFFIVPAVFIVVLGPLIAKLLQKLFSGEIGGIGGGFF
jgi:tight adherence protein C